MISGISDLIDTLKLVYPAELPPKPLHLLLAADRVRKGEDLAAVAAATGTTRAHLGRLVESADPVATLLKRPLPPLGPEREARVRRSLGQLLLGNLAEHVFEDLYRSTVGSTELQLEDDRSSYTDTDYRVINGQKRQVFRINIKFHGSPFKKAKELVGLDPDDCFALATYKIKFALDKQEAEHLAYIFLIVGVPSLTGDTVGKTIPENLVHLSAIVHEAGVSRKRAVEDAILACLVERPQVTQFEGTLGEYYDRIRAAPWFVLSARRAFNLLREKLFERAYALRVRAFARNYRNAELDMHFSSREDLTPLAEFLEILRKDGLPGVVSRLERGTI